LVYLYSAIKMTYGPKNLRYPVFYLQAINIFAKAYNEIIYRAKYIYHCCLLLQFLLLFVTIIKNL